MSERELTYGEAVREAIAVFLLGEDVAEAGQRIEGDIKPVVAMVSPFRNRM
jgi:hypothetical protein